MGADRKRVCPDECVDALFVYALFTDECVYASFTNISSTYELVDSRLKLLEFNASIASIHINKHGLKNIIILLL